MPTLCLKKDQNFGGSPEPKSSHGECVLRSGCKINLYLEIMGRLPNGYHSLKSFMLPLLPTQPPFDTMRVRYAWRNRNSDCHGHTREHQCDNQRKYTACPGLTLTSNAPYLDLQNNTLQKAYALYAAKVQAVPDLKIYLEKGVPEGAGLGGGSANAAALLLFLQSCLKEAGLNTLEPKRLNELAALVGADVPFFLLNQPAWAYGIGDKLVPAPFPFEAGRLEDNRLMTGHVATEQTETGRLETQRLLLICPPISVSTAWAYAAWDEWQGQNQQTRFLTSGKAQAISSCSAKHANSQEFGNCFTGSYAAQEFDNIFFNSFEAVIFPRYPELAEIKGQLLELGAEAALMSGSGSSVFGLFRWAAEADRASEILRATGLAVYNRAIHAGVSPSW